MYGVIYCATNTITQEKYIGQTIHYKRRIIEHKRYAKKGSSYYFHRALKSNLESFDWSIIDSADNLEELNLKEKFWIEKYHTYIGDPICNGYNLTTGGESYKVSDSTKSKISKSNTGKIPWNKGKRTIKIFPIKEKRKRNHSLETKLKISLANKGKKRSLDYKIKRSILSSGEKNPSAVTIICTDNKKIYSYARLASIELNIDLSNIIKCCKGKLKTAGGYHWEYYNG
jgi:group I intron endonuclease